MSVGSLSLSLSLSCNQKAKNISELQTTQLKEKVAFQQLWGKIAIDADASCRW
jgi:hypothetical protein